MDPRFQKRGSSLGLFIEECGEALAEAGKSVRYGLESYNPLLKPQDRETNREWLQREIKDIEFAISRLRKSKIIE